MIPSTSANTPTVQTATVQTTQDVVQTGAQAYSPAKREAASKVLPPGVPKDLQQPDAGKMLSFEPKQSQQAGRSDEDQAARKVVIGLPYRTDRRGGGHIGGDVPSGLKMGYTGSPLPKIEITEEGYANEKVAVKVLPHRFDAIPEEKYNEFGAATDADRTRVYNAEVIPGLVESRGTLTDESARAIMSQLDLLYIPGDAYEPVDLRGAHFNPCQQGSLQDQDRLSRDQYEKTLIGAAMNQGVPIFAACAGTWRVAQQLGGEVKSLTPMERMVHFSHANVTQHRHDLVIEQSLADLLGKDLTSAIANETGLLGDKLRISVNSTHAGAVIIEKRGNVLSLVSSNAEFNPNNRLEVSCYAEGYEGREAVAEGFVQKVGAPIHAFQWHPELFNRVENDANYSLFLESQSPTPGTPRLSQTIGEKIMSATFEAAQTRANKRDMHQELLLKTTLI